MATIKEQAAAIKGYAQEIDAAIVAKGGTTAGGLVNAAAAIEALPSGGGAEWVKEPWRNDGNVHMWLRVDEKFLSFNQVAQTTLSILSANGGTIDYGDGTTATYAKNTKLTAVTISHRYTQAGDYEIVVSGIDQLDFLTAFSNGSERYTARSYPFRQMEFCHFAPSNTSKYQHFSLFYNLEYVRFDDETTNLGHTFTFEKCISLKEVEGKFVNIGAYAFSGCASLASVGDLSACTNIDAYAFSGCASLASVGDLSACTNIGAYAFSGCASLASVGDLSACTNISEHTFDFCASLQEINIPSCEKIIVSNGGYYAFGNCHSLKKVISNLGNIPSYTFNGSTSINYIELGYIDDSTWTGNRFSAFSSVGNGSIVDEGEEWGAVVSARCIAKNVVNPDYGGASGAFPYSATIRTKFKFTDAIVKYDNVDKRWTCYYETFADFPNIVTMKCDAFYVDKSTGKRYRWRTSDKSYYES